MATSGIVPIKPRFCTGSTGFDGQWPPFFLNQESAVRGWSLENVLLLFVGCVSRERGGEPQRCSWGETEVCRFCQWGPNVMLVSMLVAWLVVAHPLLHI